MAHEWHAGVLNASSWHGLEVVREMTTAKDLIAAGEETKAYPLAVALEKMKTVSGLEVPGSAVVATYAGNKRIAHSAVGGKYTPLNPKEWRATIEAAVKAGARPAGAFALRGGTRVLATFEIPGGNGGTGIRNYLNLVDSLDGSIAFSAGGTSIRTVCANTLAASFSADGKGYAKVKHTASINDRSEYIRSAIEAHVKQGDEIAKLYREAKKTALDRDQAVAIINALFPAPEKGDSQKLATRKKNTRAEAAKAMHRPENNDGTNLATIWNAATWLVDRDADGNAKAARGDADKLDSLLFGQRNKRVNEIRNIIQVIMADGSIRDMDAFEAHKSGVDVSQSGKSLLDIMLEDA
jgi:hypothetical protein